MFNKLLFTIITAVIMAQGIKFIVHLIKHEKFDIATLLFEPGGMPSTHSAAVSALTASLYLTKADPAIFAISLVFSLIVMADALGVRYEAGENAKRINLLISAIGAMKKKNIHMHIQKVREILGHTPSQVFCGALIGIAVAIFMV